MIVPPAREKIFDQDFQKMLQQMYSVIYDPDDIVHVPMCYQEIKQVHIFGQLYSSLKSLRVGQLEFVACGLHLYGMPIYPL